MYKRNLSCDFLFFSTDFQRRYDAYAQFSFVDYFSSFSFFSRSRVQSTQTPQGLYSFLLLMKIQDQTKKRVTAVEGWERGKRWPPRQRDKLRFIERKETDEQLRLPSTKIIRCEKNEAEKKLDKRRATRYGISDYDCKEREGGEKIFHINRYHSYIKELQEKCVTHQQACSEK